MCSRRTFALDSHARENAVATRVQTSSPRENSSGARMLPAKTGAASNSRGQPHVARRTTNRTHAEASTQYSSSHAALDSSILATDLLVSWHCLASSDRHARNAAGTPRSP